MSRVGRINASVFQRGAGAAPRKAQSGAAPRDLDVEADLEDVALLDDVVAALHAQQRLLAGAARTSPAATRASQGMTSARMKPRSMSEWIRPAASEAVVPRRTGQARASGGPEPVKNVTRSSSR